MRSLTALDLEHARQRRGFGGTTKARLIVEVVLTYAQVRWLMARHDVQYVVGALRSRPVVERDPWTTEYLGHRLAKVVMLVLDPLPWDSRCLMRSLVLLAMLSRRGVGTSLHIGVRAEAGFEAHAWIEYAERPLLPVRGYERLTVL